MVSDKKGLGSSISFESMTFGLRTPVLPHYNRQVIVPDAPKLEARVTDGGFSVSDGTASFSYQLQPSAYAGEFGTDKYISGKRLDDFLFSESTPTSRLTITGYPAVGMRTEYMPPTIVSPGRLTLISVMSESDLLFESLRIIKMYESFSTKRTDSVDRSLAEQAVAKAHRELHLDEVYALFTRARTEAIQQAVRLQNMPKLSPQERTLAGYLGR